MIVVRDARAGEEAGIAELLVTCFDEHRAAFPPPVARTYFAEVAAIGSLRDRTELLVAEADGRLVGSVTLLPDAADDAHPWPAGGAVLRLLGVHPDVRHRGLGTLLTEECIARASARARSFLGLHTAPFMVAARRLYQHLGFTRAPQHDFDPAVHYGGPAPRAGGDAELWGLAYVLRLHEVGPAEA